MKLLTYSSLLLAVSILPAAADINITLGSGGLKAVDKESGIQFKMGGRLQFDYNNVTVDPSEGEKVTKSNDVELRRARIFMAGEIQDWAFKAQFNMSEGDSAGTPEDLYIRYKGFGKAAVVTVGKQKEGFSLEAVESSKDITMLERSAIVEAFSFGRNIGLSVAGDWGQGYYSVGIFEDSDSDKLSMNNPALDGRFVYNPVKSDDAVVHLGLGYSHRADEETFKNIELGTSVGAFHAQGEYFRLDEKDALNNDLDRDGYYVQAAYVITGEHRGYKNGAFKRIKPSSENGAWELSARYESGYGKYKDFGLEKEDGQALTAGVSWYANNNVKIGLNYGLAEVDSNDDKGQSLRLRTQLVW